MNAIAATHLGKAYKQYPNRWSRLAEWVLPSKQPRHHQRWVLQDISFTIQSGEAVGLIGINGAGKSTLLKIITGTTQSTTGSVHITGRVAALLELGLGFHPEFTGRQNALMAGQLLGLQEHEIGPLMPSIEAFAEIGDYIDQPLRVYSSGMQVRLAFAVATAVRPDILIVDEALSVGDAYFQHKCFSRIRIFLDQGTTLLFVSHDIGAIRALCARTIWLENGTIREIGETKAVLDSYATAIYAKEQDVETAGKRSLVTDCAKTEIYKQRRDCRLEFINNSNLRNDIEIFEFNKNSIAWGTGLAEITAAYLQDTNGIQLGWVVGGEEVVLTIEALAMEDLNSVIVGFMIRDRFGQNLFGDNTYIVTIDEPVNIRKKSAFRGSFRFLMPILPQGTYAITAAIAQGTQKTHVVHAWAHEALFFESHNSSGVSGLVGVPMHSIEISELKSV